MRNSVIALTVSILITSLFSSDCFISRLKSMPPALLDRRSSSLGEIRGESYYHTGDDSNAPWRRRILKSALRATSSTYSSSSGAAPTTDGSANELPPPLLSFGVIADIQYAPIPDGHSYNGVPRYYRHALSTAKHAAEHFQREKVTCVVNLGDIIDGKCQDMKDANSAVESRNPGRDAVEDVINALSAYDHGEIIHTYGNHELYNLGREELGPLLQIPFVREPCGDLVGYRSHSIQEAGLRFVVLDSYDVAVGGRCESTSEKRRQAEELLAKNNPNFPENENSPEGMEGFQRRYVAFNGAVGTRQINWLRDTLEEAKRKGEKVIVLSHQPIFPDSSNSVCLVWNYEEILQLLRSYSCTVIASFAGHAHKGGYKRCEKSGIHFRVFEAALESPSPIKTYGVVDVYHDRIVVRGSGDLQSATYDFDHMAPTCTPVSIPEDDVIVHK